MAFPIVAVLGAVLPLINKLIPDKEAAAKAQIEAMAMAQRGELAWLEADVKLALGQMEINKEEAKAGTFRGGWRPATGWLCVFGFGYMAVIRPLFPWVARVAGLEVPDLPPIDTAEIGALLFGLLGLGGMRTAERLKGKV